MDFWEILPQVQKEDIRSGIKTSKQVKFLIVKNSNYKVVSQDISRMR